MLARIENNPQQAGIDFQNGCRLPILKRVPTPIKGRLRDQDALLFEVVSYGSGYNRNNLLRP